MGLDYGKLRHLLVIGRRLNGNFDLLRNVIGEGQVDTRIQPGFPLERLTDPENLFSRTNGWRGSSRACASSA